MGARFLSPLFKTVAGISLFCGLNHAASAQAGSAPTPFPEFTDPIAPTPVLGGAGFNAGMNVQFTQHQTDSTMKNEWTGDIDLSSAPILPNAGGVHIDFAVGYKDDNSPLQTSLSTGLNVESYPSGENSSNSVLFPHVGVCMGYKLNKRLALDANFTAGLLLSGDHESSIYFNDLAGQAYREQLSAIYNLNKTISLKAGLQATQMAYDFFQGDSSNKIPANDLKSESRTKSFFGPYVGFSFSF